MLNELLSTDIMLIEIILEKLLRNLCFFSYLFIAMVNMKLLCLCDTALCTGVIKFIIVFRDYNLFIIKVHMELMNANVHIFTSKPYSFILCER